MAVDATGTPTTNYAWPTLNPSADAPSGLGENNIVAAIDTTMKVVDNKAIAAQATANAAADIGLLIALGG